MNGKMKLKQVESTATNREFYDLFRPIVPSLDITGKIVQEYTRNFDDIYEVNLDVNHLQSGFYFVQLISGDIMLTEKFVKK